MFRFSETAMYQMPAHFGGLELGSRDAALPVATYHDVTGIQIAYETDIDTLVQYVPEGFEITQPVISICYQMCRQVDWMMGGSYNLINVSVPVVYPGDEGRLEGAYVLVLWENNATPIISGREQSGMPKIFADIEDHHELEGQVFTTASYQGNGFLQINFRKTRLITADELAARNMNESRVNSFGWRYIPNVGKPGAALSHPTLFPFDLTHKAGWFGEGQVIWDQVTRELHPTQMHIINALARLPIKSYVTAEMEHMIVVLRNDMSRPLPAVKK